MPTLTKEHYYVCVIEYLDDDNAVVREDYFITHATNSVNNVVDAQRGRYIKKNLQRQALDAVSMRPNERGVRTRFYTLNPDFEEVAEGATFTLNPTVF